MEMETALFLPSNTGYGCQQNLLVPPIQSLPCAKDVLMIALYLHSVRAGVLQMNDRTERGLKLEVRTSTAARVSAGCAFPAQT